jgi:hypothetical protein
MLLKSGPASIHCEPPPSQSHTDVAVPGRVRHWPFHRLLPFCWQTRGHFPWASMLFQIGPAWVSTARASDIASDAAHANTNTSDHDWTARMNPPQIGNACPRKFSVVGAIRAQCAGRDNGG